MILNKIDDPRDSLEKATRHELFKFAQANGATDITEGMPAIVMRKILRSRGMTRISIPRRTLGQQSHHPSASAPPAPNGQEKVVEVDASDDLMRQYMQQPAAPVKSPGAMSINELRAAVKAKGLKIARTDTMDTLRAKLA